MPAECPKCHWPHAADLTCEQALERRRFFDRLGDPQPTRAEDLAEVEAARLYAAGFAELRRALAAAERAGWRGTADRIGRALRELEPWPGFMESQAREGG